MLAFCYLINKLRANCINYKNYTNYKNCTNCKKYINCKNCINCNFVNYLRVFLSCKLRLQVSKEVLNRTRAPARVRRKRRQQTRTISSKDARKGHDSAILARRSDLKVRRWLNPDLVKPSLCYTWRQAQPGD